MTQRERQKGRKASTKRTRELRCMECGNTVPMQRGAHNYEECGLPGILLVGVEVGTCPKCGEHAVVIPAVEQLHRELAREIARKEARLTAAEVRFLRKWLGYSGVDFAKLIGHRPETLSRWESTTAPRPMDQSAEQLLRLLVLTGEPLKRYPGLEPATNRPKARPCKLKLTRGGSQWSAASACA